MISFGAILGGLGAIGGFFLAPFIGIAAVAGAIGGAILGFAAADTVKAIISPDIFEGPSNAQGLAGQNTGATLNSQGTDIALPVVYGNRRIGGTRIFVSSGGENNSNLYMVLALCEGPIDYIRQVYIDDTLVFDGVTTTGTQYTVTTGKYANLVTFEAHHGVYTPTPSTLLLTGLPGSGWTSAHLLNQIAYVVVKLDYPVIASTADAERNPWSGGIPKINFEITGKLVYPASQITPAIPHADDYDTDIINYGYASTNPIDCLLDYLRNPIYGKGLSNDKIDWDSFYYARAKFWQDANGNPIEASLRHRFNGIIFTDRTVLDNVKSMLQGMRTNLPFSQGKFKVIVDSNNGTGSIYEPVSSSVMTFNHSNILPGMNIEGESTTTKYNRVVVTYMGAGVGGSNPSYEPVEITYPTPGSAEDIQYLVTEDNNRINEYRVTLEHCIHATTATEMARLLLLKSRLRGKTISFTADSSAAICDVGDIVLVQYGYSTVNYPGASATQTSPSGLVIDGLFKITNIAVNNDYTFSIVAQEHQDAIYGQQPTLVTENRGITRAASGSGVLADVYYPDPLGVGTASILALSSGIITRNGVLEPYVDIYVAYTQGPSKLLVEYKLATETNYTIWEEFPNIVNSTYQGTQAISQIKLGGLQFNRNYQFRATYKTVNYTYGQSSTATVTTPPVPSSSANYTSVSEFN